MTSSCRQNVDMEVQQTETAVKCKRRGREKEEVGREREEVGRERGEVEKEREPGKCSLYIAKRGRYCRLSVARGSKYCGEHLNFDPDIGASSTQRKRIPCPLDPHQ